MKDRNTVKQEIVDLWLKREISNEKIMQFTHADHYITKAILDDLLIFAASGRFYYE